MVIHFLYAVTEIVLRVCTYTRVYPDSEHPFEYYYYYYIRPRRINNVMAMRHGKVKKIGSDQSYFLIRKYYVFKGQTSLRAVHENRPIEIVY